MRTFYISTGEKGMKYTLRHRWVAVGVHSSQLKDDYCCVLGTDWDSSVQKAREYLKKHYGNEYKLYGDQFDLHEIIRRSSEEIAEEERLEREEKAAHALSQVRHNAHYNKSAIKRVTRDGVFKFGKYKDRMYGGTPFEDVAEDNMAYIRFCIEAAPERVGFDLSADEHPRRLNSFEIGAYGLRQWCLDNNKDWEVRPHADSTHVGAVGEKCQVEVVIESKKKEYFQYSDYSSNLSWKFTAVTDDGDVIQFTTSAKAFFTVEEGQRMVMAGTVKAHNEWDEVKSTILNRVKVAA